ncbi:NADPH-dependent F420 reductase [Azotobacter vinelandii]|uniref:NADPH-dependent F420 reductase n=1 Tax=Azotobacter TaxID=352 RepID=UPI00031734BB|nr:NADPH-dependent F420 reductase [Azotobacter vinelandii]GLK60072.1 hypothetical protein GCM10017624_22310 [Azotobacter vinelandii]SFX31932.1 hypothetical protein SAMN04244547_01162 [Azotobacter vinelandii]
MDKQRRRTLRLLAGATAAVALAAGIAPASWAAPARTGRERRIGIIGAGQVGSTLGRLWIESGHRVMFASRHPDRLGGLVAELGERAGAGSPAEAARFGEIVLLAVPYGALPQLGRDLAPLLRGKPVLDATNPYRWRDGEAADLAERQGVGLTSAGYFPDAHLVRGFNSIDASAVAGNAHKASPAIGIPLAGDDQAALEEVSALVRDAGFEPVVAGPLASARLFQPGTPLFRQVMSAERLRSRLDEQR